MNGVSPHCCAPAILVARLRHKKPLCRRVHLGRRDLRMCLDALDRPDQNVRECDLSNLRGSRRESHCASLGAEEAAVPGSAPGAVRGRSRSRGRGFSEQRLEVQAGDLCVAHWGEAEGDEARHWRVYYSAMTFVVAVVEDAFADILVPFVPDDDLLPLLVLLALAWPARPASAAPVALARSFGYPPSQTSRVLSVELPSRVERALAHIAAALLGEPLLCDRFRRVELIRVEFPTI